jgi:Flp pilus assembly protein TadD
MKRPPHDSRLGAGRSRLRHRVGPFVRSFRLYGTIRELAFGADGVPATYEFDGSEPAAELMAGTLGSGGEVPGSGEAWHHQTVDDPTEDRESAYELFQRGDDLLRKRHFAAAAIVLERASRAEPGKASILEALGRAYYNSGQHEASRAAFEALLELDPSAHYAHFALGQSLKQLGRSKEARTHLRLAVALSPNSTLYAGALARLGPPEED